MVAPLRPESADTSVPSTPLSWAPLTPTAAPPAAPPQQLTEHLLKVAGSVAHDANQTWADLWGQFKPHVTPSGAVLPEMEKGFVPACGWSEFLERLWLLKHYLDSVERICRKQQ